MNRQGTCFLLILGLMVSCTKDEEVAPPGEALFQLAVPAGWPAPPLRADNPLTAASVELGKALFFDDRLSLGRGVSCGSCHLPGHAFSDTVALSAGVQGRLGTRNAPTLANVAYHPLLNRDGGAPTLEQQVLNPLFDEAEMNADPQQVVDLLRDDPTVSALSLRAYGRPFDLYVLTRSIANYERTLIGGTSRYDRHLLGDTNALNAAEKRGLQVFNGAGNCTSCHGGFDLSDHTFHNAGASPPDAEDNGRERITLDPADRGKFKTPTLRNVALTAPYMHDGSLATLEDVIHHFNTGGADHPNKDPLVVPLHMSPAQQQDLATFLRSLNDGSPLDRVP